MCADAEKLKVKVLAHLQCFLTMLNRRRQNPLRQRDKTTVTTGPDNSLLNAALLLVALDSYLCASLSIIDQ